MTSALDIVPLTIDRWGDFESLMGPKGGQGGCWCMLWRLTKRDFDKGVSVRNRRAMKGLADGKPSPGLLAYLDNEPVGWISVAPRQDFARLEMSRVLKPVDDQDVWSVSCFFIARPLRRKGVAVQMLEAACDFVRNQGGSVVEGYPIAPTEQAYPAVYAWTGFEHVFLRAGFTEVARRSPTRPIMRRKLMEDCLGN